MPRIPLLEQDLDCFFQLNELGVEALFNGQAITVIYREDYFNAGSGLVGIDNTGPYFLAKIDSVPDIKQGDSIDIDGDLFTVSGVQPALSQGYTRVNLEVT